MITDPAALRVADDLEEAEFVSGVQAGHWRVLRYKHPNLYFAVAATEPDGSPSEYSFWAELTNFPASNPQVRIWNYADDKPIPKELRPKGDHRVTVSFQWWGLDTVYRPWDRQAGPHDSTRANNTHMAWHSKRHLSYILRDIHGLLNINARAHRLRASA